MPRVPSTPAIAELLGLLVDRQNRLKKLLKPAAAAGRALLPNKERGKVLLSAEIAELTKRVGALKDLERRGVPHTAPEYVDAASYDPTDVQIRAVQAREAA